MPAESKGPRLWYKPGNQKPTGGRYLGTWIIKDGDERISTGFRSARRGKAPQGAEEALANYILARRQIPREPDRPASQVKIADVIAIYLVDKVPKVARPDETISRIGHLLTFWGERSLDAVNGRTCREYVDSRGGKPVARRELEDFQAAIGYHRKEGLCREIIEVALPEKGMPRERWLNRSEAARLIWAAWRYREVQKGQPTGRRSRQHVARFALVALYTGSRAGTVCAASLTPATHTGWVDLDAGVFYRKGSLERQTKKRRPPVRLPDRLVGHMRRWKKNGQRYAVEWLGEPIGTGVEKAFRRACQDAGLENVTPHTLRHTAATWLMQRGTDLWQAAGFLGMTTETLEHTYGHHSPAFQSQAARNITRKK
jgi:integrase